MARKPKGNGKAPETSESPGGATGRGMERQGEEGRLKGLVRYPPGNKRRRAPGPDRQLRINVVRSILLEALAKDGVRLAITPAGRRRRHRSKIPMAAPSSPAPLRSLAPILKCGAEPKGREECPARWLVSISGPSSRALAVGTGLCASPWGRGLTRLTLD